MIDLTISWFKIVKIRKFDLKEVALGNGEYIYKSYARVRNLFNKIWKCRYPRPCKVVFNNGSKFKWDFNTLLKDFNVKPVLTSVKNPQDNAPVERTHQVILNMLVTKDLDNKVFNYIDPWGETLIYIEWAIRAYYYFTVLSTPGQSVIHSYICYLTLRQFLTVEL